jgi:competence protein ComEA
MSGDEPPLDRPRPVTPWPEHVRALLGWIGVGRIVAIGLSVAAVGAGGYWLLRAPPPPVEASLPMATTSPPAPGATVASGGGEPPGSPTTAASTLVVHVAGAVIEPGVYRLAGGSRVVDALTAAGGPALDADLEALNLAALAVDGQQVYVPRVGEPPGGGAPAAAPASGAASGPAFPLDLNQADAAALDALPGIGPATAAAIVAHREANGPFASVDELLDVRGIGPAKLEALRPLVRV